MENFQLLVHIGYPKAASTWLQQTIFNEPKISFTSPWGATSGIAVDQFITTNAFRFSPPSTYQVFEPGLKEAARQKLIPILSQEMLSCDQIGGRYWSKEVADRLHAVFPSAAILILIREQKSMVLSSYGQYIRNGGVHSISHFIGADVGRENSLPGFSAICRLDYLEYDLLISYYHQLFGKNRVLVLPFELLKSNPYNLIQKILNFVGIDQEVNEFKKSQNINYKAYTLNLMRKMNNFLPPPDFSRKTHPLVWRLAWKTLNTVDRMLPSVIQKEEECRLKKYIADFIGDRFAQSNRQTSQLIGIDLGEYGYDC
jgi:hypothetical protein